MNENEKEEIELDIEAKYVGKTEKEFLSRVTYAECLYILTPENKYCDKIRKLSVLKICEIIEKQQKQIEELNIRLQEEINEKCKLKTELYLNSIPKTVIQDKIEEIINNPTYGYVGCEWNDIEVVQLLENMLKGEE